MKKIMVGVFALCAVLVFSCSKVKDESLQAVVVSSQTYTSTEGDKVVATFYELSDKSLDFVKVDFNSMVLTLPHLVSADGARFSDEMENELWFKEDSLSVFVRDELGDFVLSKEYKVEK